MAHLKEVGYDNERAVAYAHKWAFARNSKYFNLAGLGGDCTNFISQCIFAGAPVMNYNTNLGWFYNSPISRAPAWTSVHALFDFLTKNKGVGPYGRVVALEEVVPGDIIQLSLNNVRFHHSLIVVETGIPPIPENILVATHTYDSDYRSLSSYRYHYLRAIHIEGARQWA